MHLMFIFELGSLPTSHNHRDSVSAIQQGMAVGVLELASSDTSWYYGIDISLVADTFYTYLRVFYLWFLTEE